MKTAVSAERWNWLFAPARADLGFAVRTACAAILSLLIAMWMELGSPQWAPLTVWTVATASRGESFSKARWRLAGTVVGCGVGVALIAAFPQEAGLFFLCLALWTGVCCGLATAFDGYRSYGFLVASFTAAIVATDGIASPGDAFFIAMARGTYIALGILCEAVLAMLFSPGMRERARGALLARLRGVSAMARQRLENWHAAEPGPATESALLADIMTASARIEFDVLEMGPAAGRVADHARAAVADLLAAMARVRAGAPWASVLRRLDGGERHIEAIAAPRRGDRFRFRSRSVRQATQGLRNGARVAAGVLAASVIWYVTAWPSGIGFIAYVVLVYGLLATREVPVLASAAFARGAVWCAVVAAVYVLLIVPMVTAPEMLAFCLLVPMVVGGLAARTPRLANHAFSFNMFLPVLIGPSNAGRYDESAFLNGTMAFLAAVFFAGAMFRLVLPFRPDEHLRRTIGWAERRLPGLATGRSVPSARVWLMTNAESMVRAVRTGRGVGEELLFAYFAAHMAVMVQGLCVIEIREAMAGGALPVPVARRLAAFLRVWTRNPARAAALVPALLRRAEMRAPAGEDLAAALRAIMLHDRSGGVSGR
ncbi:FUSC family protein [Gluconacetobacter dulcium]|uniref:FUSC family protein n=1 Tax=Gluconacetobacter dulcium TaxID=2729096 RepID=UPI00287B9086|nr:FUSC family protein [Gluconacetobacter dulcium]